MMNDLCVTESDKESEKEESQFIDSEKSEHADEPQVQNVDSGGGELMLENFKRDVNIAVDAWSWKDVYVYVYVYVNVLHTVMCLCLFRAWYAQRRHSKG